MCSVAEALGIHLLEIEAYELLGDSTIKTEGALLAVAERAKSCAPCIMLLKHVEALGGKQETPRNEKETTALLQAAKILQSAFNETHYPALLIATTSEEDKLTTSSRSVFKQVVEVKAPSEKERMQLLEELTQRLELAPDVDLKDLARQTAAMQVEDLVNLVGMMRNVALGEAFASG